MIVNFRRREVDQSIDTQGSHFSLYDTIVEAVATTPRRMPYLENARSRIRANQNSCMFRFGP
jgi:hypothetical protein